MSNSGRKFGSTSQVESGRGPVVRVSVLGPCKMLSLWLIKKKCSHLSLYKKTQFILSNQNFRKHLFSFSFFQSLIQKVWLFILNAGIKAFTRHYIDIKKNVMLILSSHFLNSPVESWSEVLVPSKPTRARPGRASCHLNGTGVKPVLPVRLRGSQVPPLV